MGRFWEYRFIYVLLFYTVGMASKVSASNPTVYINLFPQYISITAPASNLTQSLIEAMENKCPNSHLNPLYHASTNPPTLYHQLTTNNAACAQGVLGQLAQTKTLTYSLTNFTGSPPSATAGTTPLEQVSYYIEGERPSSPGCRSSKTPWTWDQISSLCSHSPPVEPSNWCSENWNRWYWTQNCPSSTFQECGFNNCCADNNYA